MYIGSIDIGGTKTITAVTDDNGCIISKKTFSTDIDDCYRHFDVCCKQLKKLTAAINIDISDLYGIGINVPGMYNPTTQILVKAPVASWENVEVVRYFREKLNFYYVYADNDVKTCALGEKYFGYKDKYKDYIWITISTGIGGAIVLNGKLLRGTDNFAGEIGHIKVAYENPNECSCGQFGCLEAHASGTSITNAVLSETEKDDVFKREFTMHNIPMDARGCSVLAEMGVQKAISIYDDMTDYLARGIATVINLINPQVVILGGGVSDSIDLLMPMIRKHIKKYVIAELAYTPIVHTKLGYEAALVGTAALVMESRAANTAP